MVFLAPSTATPGIMHCRLGGHSIHQYASRLAAIGIQKFPELSSYGRQSFHFREIIFISTKNEQAFSEREGWYTFLCRKIHLLCTDRLSLWHITSMNLLPKKINQSRMSVSESFAKGWNDRRGRGEGSHRARHSPLFAKVRLSPLSWFIPYHRN